MRKRVLMLLQIMFAAAVSHAQVFAQAPAIATPPRQNEPWTPPQTALPAYFIEATQTLFEQGLADPRGCEYRAIRIKVSGIHLASPEVDTHGWVLSVAEGEKPRFVVAWNGIVYPLVGSGAPADLDADIRGLIEAAKKPPPDGRPIFPGGVQHQTFGSRWMLDEAQSVMTETLLAGKVCLLLRLGRVDLAESVWTMGTGRALNPNRPARKSKFDLTPYGVSYLSLAQEVSSMWYARAIHAHLGGEDELALADARALTAFAKAVDAKAAAMGFEPARLLHRDSASIYLGLYQLKPLLEDQERRARERAQPPPPIEPKTPEARVEAAIRKLDRLGASALWWTRVHGAAAPPNTPFAEIIAEGDAAVEPLIKALRTESRLTRGGIDTMKLTYPPIIESVATVEFRILQEILDGANLNAPGMMGRDNRIHIQADVADEIQAYWDKNRAIPPTERWYRMLADDHAKNRDWLTAAGSIVERQLVPQPPVNPAAPRGPRPRRRRGPLKGESLRDNRKPSVTELMIKRIDAMLATQEGQNFDLMHPRSMTYDLANWDPVGGLPTLQKMFNLCLSRFVPIENRQTGDLERLAFSITELALARDRGGDPEALRDYAKWLRTAPREVFADMMNKILEPLWLRRENPDIAAATDWLFNDPASPLVPLLLEKRSRFDSYNLNWIVSPLVDVPGFRKMLFRELENRKPVGAAEIGADNMVAVSLNNGISVGGSLPRKDADPPAKGAKAVVRVCDYFAWRLSELDGAPIFNPCWSEDRRDRACKAFAEFLEIKQPTELDEPAVAAPVAPR